MRTAVVVFPFVPVTAMTAPRMEAHGILGLGDPTHPPSTQVPQHRSVPGDPRGRHDVPGCRDPLEVVDAQIDVGADRREHPRTSPGSAIRREIRDVDSRALLEGEPGRRIAARPETDHGDRAGRSRTRRPRLIGQPAGHRIFSVLRARSAERTPRIQKRMTTFDSACPAFSK